MIDVGLAATTGVFPVNYMAVASFWTPQVPVELINHVGEIVVVGICNNGFGCNG